MSYTVQEPSKSSIAAGWLFALTVILLFAMPSQAQVGAVTGRVNAHGVAHNGDAVVYIERIPDRTFQPPSDPIVLDQVKLAFIPHVLPVVAGTTIAFPNSDAVRHNVFSTSLPKRFNLGNYPPGVTKYIVFNKPGVVTLLCNVHTEMSAYVVVLETPYFAVSDREGNFAMRDIPPGNYSLSIWHEQLKPQSKSVRITAGVTARIDFDLR